MDTVFNETEALARLGDNKDLLLKISAYFVVYAQKQIDLLRDAFISDDQEKLRFLTHKLLGSIANFGTQSAYESGHRLQSILADGDNEAAPAEYRRFVSEVEKLQKVLAIYSDGIEPPDLENE